MHDGLWGIEGDFLCDTCFQYCWGPPSVLLRPTLTTPSNRSVTNKRLCMPIIQLTPTGYEQGTHGPWFVYESTHAPKLFVARRVTSKTSVVLTFFQQRKVTVVSLLLFCSFELSPLSCLH